MNVAVCQMFFCIYWDGNLFFFLFQSINVLNGNDLHRFFSNIKYIFLNEIHLVMRYIFLNSIEFGLQKFCLTCSHLYPWRMLFRTFHFFVLFCLVFYQDNADLVEWIQCVPSSSVFWKIFCEIDVLGRILMWKIGVLDRIHQWRYLMTFLCNKVLRYNFIYLIDIWLFILLIFSKVRVDSIFQEITHFIYVVQFVVRKLFKIFSYPFSLCIICIGVISLIPDISNIFYSWWVWLLDY